MLKGAYKNLDGIEKNFSKLYGQVADEQLCRYERLFNWFKTEFCQTEAYFASSSGRVEVCGNHTDHNGGKVVSCAISLDTVAAFMPTANNVIHIKSEGYNDIIIDVNSTSKEEKGTSSSLVRGVVEGLKDRKYKVGGFNACITSNVLGGAGISSSASFEVLVAEILNFLYNDGKINQQTKAIVAQFAENVYFGKPCGLLDQTAIAYGGLKRLDFFNKGEILVTEISNELEDYTLILINTGGSHANLTDEYASIPQEMFSVANALGKERLIDVGEQEFYEQLSTIYNKISDRAILRAIHFFDENNRVDNVFKALNDNDYSFFLKMINESGESSLSILQNCYISGSDIQLIPKAIAVAKKNYSVGASRVHGGGFAGSILNIIKNDQVQQFVLSMKRYFSEKDIIPLHVRGVGTIVL